MIDIIYLKFLILILKINTKLKLFLLYILKYLLKHIIIKNFINTKKLIIIKIFY